MSNPIVPLGSYITRTITIPALETGSTKVDLNGATLVGIFFPAMTSTAVGINVSTAIDGTFVPAYHNFGGTISNLTVGASARYLSVNPLVESSGIKYLQLIAGSTESAERTITLVLKGL